MALALLGLGVPAAGFVFLHSGGAPTTAAAAAPSLSVLPADAAGVPIPGPGYFVVTAAPGQTVSLHALIVNHGQMRPTLALAPVDALRTASGLSYALPDDARRGAGAWLQLSHSRLRLRPNAVRLVELTLRVPAHVSDRTYIGALSVSFAGGESPVAATASLRVQTRLVIAAVVQVRGKRQA